MLHVNTINEKMNGAQRLLKHGDNSTQIFYRRGTVTRVMLLLDFISPTIYYTVYTRPGTTSLRFALQAIAV